MKLTTFQKVSGLVLAGLFAAQAQAQVPDIPASVSGTYTLTYDFVQSGSPFTKGTVKSFVLNGSTDTLCVDGVSLGTGYFRAGAGSEMLWNGGDGIYYAVSLRTSGEFNEINVYSPSDAGSNWKGQFPGPGTYSSAVACGGAAAPTLTSEQEAVIEIAASLYPDLFTSHGDIMSAEGYTYLTFNSGVSVGFKDGNLYVAGGPFGADIQNKGTIAQVTTALTNQRNSVTVTPTADMTSLFNLAAQVYPTLFTNGTSFQTSADGYLYKYFDTGIYAAIKDGQVYVKGGQFGSAYTSVGALNAVLSQLNTVVNGGGGTTIPSGNYNLVVSGTVSILGFAQPFSYTITGIPAPDLSDQDDIEQAFRDSLGSSSASGVTINSFNYTVVSSTSDLVEFNVSVSATASGISYSYTLNYKYTK